MAQLSDPLALATVVFAALAASVVIWFLWKQPALVSSTKLLLFAGILILPVGAAFTGNVRGYEVSQGREFCGSCHVMIPYTEDSNNPASKTLAARHARTELFGEKNCYMCHANYGMFGTVLTKINGLHHVYAYYTKYSSVPLADTLGKIELYHPFDNSSCLHCHSTKTEGWTKIKDHLGAEDDARTGKLSCASEGCHGPSHPFSKQREVSP